MTLEDSTRKILPYILKPLSWTYGVVADVRNWLFDHNVLPVEEFDVPVVSIGNLTVGGTGKTPHVEYVVGMLAASCNTVVLSRGYKRKTRGFVLANPNSTPESIGDEPMQIYLKHGKTARVAVCENRRKGIKEIMRQFPDTELILLDDAFQHRYVKPKVNVLLMDYNRPVYEDRMLPYGRLREPAHNINGRRLQMPGRPAASFIQAHLEETRPDAISEALLLQHCLRRPDARLPRRQAL